MRDAKADQLSILPTIIVCMAQRLRLIEDDDTERARRRQIQDDWKKMLFLEQEREHLRQWGRVTHWNHALRKHKNVRQWKRRWCCLLHWRRRTDLMFTWLQNNTGNVDSGDCKSEIQWPSQRHHLITKTVTTTAGDNKQSCCYDGQNNFMDYQHYVQQHE